MNPNILCIIVKCAIAGVVLAATISDKEKEEEKKNVKAIRK